MKITKISESGFSQDITNAKTPEQVESILNKAYQKRNLEAFYEAIVKSSNSHINFMTQNSIHLLYNMLNANINNQWTDDIIYLLLNHYAGTIEHPLKLAGICMSSPDLASIALLSERTPPQVSQIIIETNNLFITKTATLQNNKILQAIIRDLIDGAHWKNEYSALTLLTRLSQGGNYDDFIQEASKYNLSPEVSMIFYRASDKYKNNKIIKQNLDNNKNIGMQLIKMNIHFKMNFDTEEKTIDELINILHQPGHDEYIDWIINWIKNNIFIANCFNYEPNNQNLLRILIQESPNIISDIIDIIISKPNLINEIKLSSVFPEIINEGLLNPSTKDKILNLPKSTFDLLPMTDTNRKIVEEHFKEQIIKNKPKENIFDIEEILGNNKRWFIKYTEAREILREAGWRENIATGLLAAILMVFGGSTLKSAADKNHIKVEDLLKAMQDRPTVEKVYEIYTENQEPYAEERELDDIQKIQMPQVPKNPQIKPKADKTEFNNIIQAILQHESLVPGQTPFRITNPNMKKWNKIHGFQIDKNPEAPMNRQNFIFLKNPNEVPIAVKKQFENYAYNPQKYGLPKNPTLEDALRLFDQTGAKGKMAFIKNKFPFIDFQTPLLSLLTA